MKLDQLNREIKIWKGRSKLSYYEGEIPIHFSGLKSSYNDHNMYRYRDRILYSYDPELLILSEQSSKQIHRSYYAQQEQGIVPTYYLATKSYGYAAFCINPDLSYEEYLSKLNPPKFPLSGRYSGKTEVVVRVVNKDGILVKEQIITVPIREPNVYPRTLAHTQNQQNHVI